MSTRCREVALDHWCRDGALFIMAGRCNFARCLMLFRNLQLYRITRPLSLDHEALDERLAAHGSRPCGPLEPATYGWAPPLESGTAYTHAAAGCLLLCARREERLLPAAVVRDELDAKVQDIEAEQGRKVGRRERTQLRDELVQTMLPRAFTRSQRTLAYLDERNGWLVVDAANRNRADELVTLLRDCLDSLPVQPPAVQTAPASVMTRWLAGGSAAPGWMVLDECELQDTDDEAGRIACKRQDLTSDEIRAHLRAGKQVIRMALDWRERLNFVLHDDLSVRRLRFADVVAEELERVESDDRAALFDAQFALLTLELSKLLPELLQVLGGEARDQYRSAAA